MILFFSCIPTLSGDFSPPSFSAPQITNFEIECAEEDELWTFKLTADAWTGNGLLWILDSDTHEEEHPLVSEGAPRDGSSDTLKIELSIVGDWRDAQRGKSTRWPCSAQSELSMLVEIYHPKDHTPSDCLATGPLWPEETSPIQCDQYWED